MLLVLDRGIAQDGPYATGYRFDNGVRQVILSLKPGAFVIMQGISQSKFDGREAPRQ